MTQLLPHTFLLLKRVGGFNCALVIHADPCYSVFDLAQAFNLLHQLAFMVNGSYQLDLSSTLIFGFVYLHFDPQPLIQNDASLTVEFSMPQG